MMKLDSMSSDRITGLIRQIVLKYPELRGFRVFFFGSRVKGTNTKTSDIDVGIEGPSPVPWTILSKIRDDIDNLPILYTIDMVDFSRTNPGFQEMATKHTEDIVSPETWQNIPSTTNN